MDLVEQFDHEHGEYHNLSGARRVMMRRVLTDLMAGRDPLTLGADEVRAYLALRIAGGAAPSTVRKELMAIRPFFKWLWLRKLVDAQRWLEVTEVRPPRGGTNGVPNPYSRAEIKDFWRELDDAYPLPDNPERWLGRFERGLSRWRRAQAYAKRVQIEAIAGAALFGGARREEIFRFQLEAIHPDNEYLAVLGARKNPEAEERWRPVPWNDELAAVIGAWLTLRKRLGPPHDSVWLSLHGAEHYLKPMRWDRFEDRLGSIGRGWEFRRMRHTYATEQLRTGMPIETLQRAMGHAKIQQTLAYAQLVPSDIVHVASRNQASFSRVVGRNFDRAAA